MLIKGQSRYSEGHSTQSPDFPIKISKLQNSLYGHSPALRQEDVGLLLILILLGVLPLEEDVGLLLVLILLGVLPLEEDVGLILLLILLGVLPLGADVGESEGAVVGVDVVGPGIGDAVVAVRV